jgi:hypothetical protein
MLLTEERARILTVRIQSTMHKMINSRLSSTTAFKIIKGTKLITFTQAYYKEIREHDHLERRFSNDTYHT